jgi:hypothetical protein
MNSKLRKKSATLYDVGGWILFPLLFGVIGIVGVVIDYFWNYLIFHLSLRRLDLIFSLGKKITYCLIITALGLFIDWLYYELAWGTFIVGPVRIAAAFPRASSHPVLEILTILIPMILIALVNYIVSRLFLKVNNHEGLVISIMMGIFTAPWLIIVYVVTTLFS